MIILAGLVTEEMAHDEVGYFRSPEGHLYNFKFEITLEDNGDGYVRFYDSIGRMVPVDFTEIQDVAEMFGRIARFSAERKVVTQELINDLQNKDTWLADELRDITG